VTAIILSIAEARAPIRQLGQRPKQSSLSCSSKDCQGALEHYECSFWSDGCSVHMGEVDELTVGVAR
jgi:hypothetical protein